MLEGTLLKSTTPISLIESLIIASTILYLLVNLLEIIIVMIHAGLWCWVSSPESLKVGPFPFILNPVILDHG